MDDKMNQTFSKGQRSPSPNTAISEWLKKEGILDDDYQDPPVSHVNQNIQGFFIDNDNQDPVELNSEEPYTILEIGECHNNVGIVDDGIQDWPIENVYTAQEIPQNDNQAPEEPNAVLETGGSQNDYLLLDLGNAEDLNKIQEAFQPENVEPVQEVNLAGRDEIFRAVQGLQEYLPEQVGEISQYQNQRLAIGDLQDSGPFQKLSNKNDVAWDTPEICETLDIEGAEDPSKTLLIPLEAYQVQEAGGPDNVLDYTRFEPFETAVDGPSAQTQEILVPLETHQVQGVGETVYDIRSYELMEPAVVQPFVPAAAAAALTLGPAEAPQRHSVIHRCIGGIQVPLDIIEALQRRSRLEPSLPPAAILALATFPGSTNIFDPSAEPVAENFIRRRSFIGKRTHGPVPEAEKDEKYWKKRILNSEATRRSRENKRIKLNQVKLRIGFLEAENMLLDNRMTELRLERKRLLQAIPK